ncbi:MAG TPA: zinc metalloprotease HtpX [Candidatus Paceibacterota bacterium]|nr:zinc metalloprotease HtpX [Candidatus Paceibacterota bacterium]
MATLYTQQHKNIRKTWFLMATFLIIVVAFGFIFSQIYNNPTILYFTVLFSIFMNLFSYWNSDKIALSVSGAKPAGELEYIELHRIVENLSITAGLPKPKVYVIDDPAPNAFATGRNSKHAAVAVTTGLLQVLDRSELEGVLAHELSHIGNRDILVSTVAVVLAGFISILADMFLRGTFFGGGRSDREGKGNILMIIGIVLAILAPIFATLVQLAISRKREYLADASGALLTRYPEGLARALEKIGAYARPMIRKSHATSHLFISNPFGGAGKKAASLFATHPPIEDRIKVLRDMSI